MTGSTARSRPQSLPVEVTSFVGRRRELAEVKRLLATTRLLTLTGSGGAGKTRLALRAAAEMARGFPDGAWFVQLAPIEDPLRVTQAVFSALGLQDYSTGWSLSTLADYLATKRLLLVLDNCEHLLDSCAVLAATLLKSSPELHLLVTSRQALGTAGEVRMRVPSLSLPEEGGDVSSERLLSFDAVALLAERAAAVAPAFKVDAGNAAEVLRLCRRLDGIPLALELAAVRLEALSLNQLNEVLVGELSLLGAGNRGAEPRQRTLEATIGWSYGLLDEQERRLWARLSVFAGGFDQEAAIRVCADPELPPERIVQLLAALVDKSILKRDSSVEPVRYQLLETLRDYGRLRLRELGDEVDRQARHRDWVLEIALAVGAWDRRQADMFNRVHLERDNLWAALEFCMRQPGEVAKGAEICRQLWVYWVSRGPLGDSRRVVRSLLDRSEPDSLARAHLLMVDSVLAQAQNDYPNAGLMAAESLRIARALKDPETTGWSLVWLAIPRWVQGDMAEARELAEDALSLARLMDMPQIELGVLNILSAIAISVGDLDRVIELGEEALAASIEAGELWARGYILNFLSQARWQRGEHHLAETQAREAADFKHALDDRHGLAIVLETLAWMAAERAAHKRTATLLGCAERVRESLATQVLAQFLEQHEHSSTTAREGLGDTAFATAFELGRAMTIDECAAFALDRKERTKPTPGDAPGQPSPLTKRELEIARLIADGMTTHQLAAKLFISERTVETHVTNMLNKLGLNSRIQLASWVSSEAGPPNS